EVRTGIVYATLIIVLVFVPLFVLPGIEGRLFAPLGVAYIVSILASMLVSITLTPVMASFLLTGRGAQGILHRGGDTPLVRWLKGIDTRLLNWSFQHGKALLAVAAVCVLIAAASLAWLPRAFLPPFNEGTLMVSVTLNPGTSLTESGRIGAQAERLIASVPEVKQVGRRTGRAEMDEHAEGVHTSEIEVELSPS